MKVHNTTEYPNQPLLDGDCNLLICPITRSIFPYQPNAVLAIIPLAIFALGLVAHLFLGIRHRTWTFMAAVVAFCLLEVGGYAARYLAHNEPFKKDYFLVQIMMLTMAPVFICAGMYICLGRIVSVYGAGISRLAPKWYTHIFVTCDVISLALQGAGGGLSASADSLDKQEMGVNITMGGLCFQVATLIAFSTLGLEFAWRVRYHGSQLNPETYETRKSRKWKGFVTALCLAVLFIIVRSVYRIAEMAGGYDSPLQSNQWTFLIFEGVFVILATVVLIVFHPGPAFGSLWITSNKVKGKAENRVTDGSELEMQPFSK